jgi:short-subunit dehydrogenase
MQMTNDSVRPVALITGASAGLGLDFVRALSQRGYDLIVVARRAERLEAVAAEAAASGVAAQVLPADLTTQDDLARVADRIRTCERLAMLVNNAGFGIDALYHKSDVRGQMDMARLHVLAPCHLTHAALPGMVARGEGAVINVSSVAAYLQGAGNVMYCATKAFLRDFTLGLAVELAGTGVRVQVLCPGFTRTDFHDVMGMDTGLIPKYLWLQADYVVAQSLRDLERGRVISIPSARYKLLAGMLRIMPRWLMNRMSRQRLEQG